MTPLSCSNTHIGPGTMTVMAGPCAIESKEQLLSTAFAVKKAGATFLRGGAYKPVLPHTLSRDWKKKA